MERPIESVIHIRHGRNVVHVVNATHYILYRVEIGNVPGAKLQICAMPRRLAIEHDYFVPCSAERVDDVRTDEPAAASD
jgi:hypothetical protein